MKINDLELKANKNRKRAGRGHAAGRGKTAGRGHKGQNARSGGKSKRGAGFEGGQSPLVKRIPKLRGFKSFKTPKATVSTDSLIKMDAKEINIAELKKAKIVSPKYTQFKVVSGNAKISKKYAIVANGISSGALENIEKAGGSYKELHNVSTPTKSKPKKKK